VNKWSRHEAILSAPPLDTWPQVLIEAIDEPMREKYLARVNAMRMYFLNERVAKIEKITGVRASMLPHLGKRCLLIAGDGLISGFRALVHHTRSKSYDRRAPIGHKFSEDRGGMAGSLNLLIKDFPEIEATLVRMIRQDSKERQVPEHKIRARDLHRLFIRMLKARGVGEQEWPFNTKYRGQRTIQKFMLEVLNRNFVTSVSGRESQEAKAHLHVGTGFESFLSYDEPFSAVEIDGYYIDCHLTVSLTTPEGTQVEALLDRLWLIALVDRFSGAILSYKVVYRSQVTADDILKVISSAVSHKWEPLQLTVPIRYPDGGGLPSGVIPEAHGVCWTMLLLDGALAHLASAVHERARKSLGFSINWGPVAHFEKRPNVEKTFDKIANELFKRLPSTTGGGAA
jgi:putative transposase